MQLMSLGIDPNTDRIANVSRGIHNFLASYIELYSERETRGPTTLDPISGSVFSLCKVHFSFHLHLIK